MTDKLTVAVVGLGYFSQFHLAAWQADPSVGAVVATDIDPARREWAARQFGVPCDDDLQALLSGLDPDIVDIVAPPPAHEHLIDQCLRKDRIVICQKPFCTSLSQAKGVVARAEAAATTVVIHENFRFQPWYRTLRAFMESGGLGQVYQCRFSLRPGDGRGADAYQQRQPAFRKMQRLLIHETGVHFIDLFQWLFGPVAAVYADLQRLNPVIQGEDSGLLVLDHANGARSLFDGNRLSDHATTNPRRTMGEMQLDAEKGTLRLDGMGRLFFRSFGQPNEHQLPLDAPIDDASFGGGCVAALCRHVTAAATGAGQLENTARDYLEVIRVTDAAYASARQGRKITLGKETD